MLLIGCIVALAAAAAYVLANDGNKICESTELEPLSGNGIKLSKNVRLSLQQSNEHVLMVAPSGVGKTRKFIIPNINALDNCSIIVTDPSGEIEKSVKTNKKVYTLNPFSSKTIGYDPLRMCRNEFEVRKAAEVILKNGMVKDSQNSRQDEFIQMATPLLTAYMLFNYHTKRYNFLDMIKNVCSKPIYMKNPTDECIYGEICNSGVESAETEIDIFMQVIGSMQTMSSIRIVMNSCLQMFFDSNLVNMLTKPSIDFNKLREEQSILYIQIPERHSEHYAPLTATFLTQIIDSLLDKPEGLQTYMLLDEFTNIGIIPNMCQLLSTARKRNLSIVCAIQNLTQLHRVYGEIEGKELRELFKSILVCAGLRDSCEYISGLLGTKTVTDDKNATRKEPLLSPDEIRRMSLDDVLIICNNKRPVRDHILDLAV